MIGLFFKMASIRSSTYQPNLILIFYHFSSLILVFDDEECKVDDWDEPLGLVPGQDKSWGLFSNPTVINM